MKNDAADLGPYGKFAAVLIITISVCFLLLTIPYWIAVSVQVDAISILVWSLSAVVLIVLAFCGMFGSIVEHTECLVIFGSINVVLWILGMVQLSMYYVVLQQCGKDEMWGNSWLGAICNPKVNDLWLWVPGFIAQFLTACSACMAFSMKRRIEIRKPSKAYNWGVGGGA
eukprot:TRINITY_DN15745_c0_g1_i1.p1 TRINITY_DN15745_c0_g1~~TRINITY_DN15745_c0_g1_i1.p1  ORF type:complete len:170 (-),score=19.38 TRINITY_DN15745_c0_g1_i1:21-530(-)